MIELVGLGCISYKQWQLYQKRDEMAALASLPLSFVVTHVPHAFKHNRPLVLVGGTYVLCCNFHETHVLPPSSRLPRQLCGCHILMSLSGSSCSSCPEHKLCGCTEACERWHRVCMCTHSCPGSHFAWGRLRSTANLHFSSTQNNS